MDNLEIEIKLTLADEAARNAFLLAMPPPRETIMQANHFFDSEDHRLRKHRITLRLRKAMNLNNTECGWELTMKGPGESQDSKLLSVRTEYNLEITAAVAQQLLADPSQVLGVMSVDQTLSRREDSEVSTSWQSDDREGRMKLAFLGVKALEGADLKTLGQFLNERAFIETELAGEPVVLEVDRTMFPGRTDFEVEVELPSKERAVAAEAALRAKFAELGLTPGTAKGKASRFYDLLPALGCPSIV